MIKNMNSRTEDLLENQKYLDDLLNKVWKEDILNSQEMTNLKTSIKTGDIIAIKDNIKELVLTSFKLGYHYGFRDGEKPQKDERHNELMKNSEETLVLMQDIMKKLNIK